MNCLRKHGLILLFLFYISFLSVHSQTVSRYNTFSYGVNEGLLQTTIRDIEIDRDNFCWISFPNGIQKFDGYRFVNISVQDGLPDDNYTDLFRSSNGDLLISHAKGISRYNTDTDNFTLIQNRINSLQWPLAFIGEYEGLIYYYDETGIISAFTVSNYKKVFEFKTGLPLPYLDVTKRAGFSENIIENNVALKIDSLLYLIDLKNKRVLHKTVIPKIKYTHLLQMKSGYEVFYYDAQSANKLISIDLKTGNKSTILIKGKDQDNISRFGMLKWAGKILMYFNNRLYEADSLGQIRSELLNFQNQPVANNVSIAKLISDNYGNLFIQTVSGGIRKILRHNYPVRYFGIAESNQNNTLAILPDKKNNRILSGGKGGLFIYDTLQQVVKHIKTIGPDSRFVPNGILKSETGDYLIFVTGHKTAYRLSYDLNNITPVPITTIYSNWEGYVDFFGNVLFNNGKNAVFQSQSALYNIDFINNSIKGHKFSDEYIMGGLWYKNTIIAHAKNEFIFMDGHSFQELYRIPFYEMSGVRCFTTDGQGSLYVGTNKGIYKISSAGKILKTWNKSFGLPDECIYAMRFDKQGALWCSTNKGIVRIERSNSLFIISRQDGLQENEFNTNVFAESEDGEFFFGGINGVSSFFPFHLADIKDNIKILITGINANNTLIYNHEANTLKELILPSGQNSLSFDFIAMGSNNPDQYIYQYRMTELDKEWIQSENLQTLRYSLSPGKYKLQLYASRQFNKDALPMKELTIIINPPFWRTWWFYTIVSVLFIILIVSALNIYNKNKYAKKLRTLESENRLKEERERISRDLHDNLGAYSNAILYNTELLEKEKSDQRKNLILKDLRFASKEILTTLRETIWALNKEEYSAEDCLLRIRNFVQTMNRFYTDIHMTVNGSAPSDRIFHSRDAFNLVRTIQEAISNSIKHSGCNNIEVNSIVHNTQWKLVISDNGSGYNPDDEERSSEGNGISNMQLRARESGFTLTTDTIAATGTRITIIV